jgi:vancomycin resistance protein YoaR
MTTRTESLPAAAETRSGGFSWRRLTFSFLLTLIATAVFVLAFALGYTAYHAERIAPGVEMAGVSLAGLDRAAAAAELRRSLPSLSSGQLSVTFGDVEDVVAYSAIGRDYNMQLMLDQAFALGHGGTIASDFQSELEILLNGVSIEPSVTWSGDRLADALAEIALAATTPAVDATIVRDHGKFVAVPAHDGETVDIEEGMRRALAAIDNTSPASRSVELAAIPLPPEISTAVAEEAAARAERVAAGGLSISALGESATIDADTLRGWIRLDASQPGVWPMIIEQEPIHQYVATFAQTADQPPVDASFKFDGGSVRAVPAEDGHLVDVETSASRIFDSLVGRADGGPNGNVNLAIATVPAGFTTQEARDLAPRVERISKWTTHFVPGSLNGNGINISLPAKIINGTVLEPGEEFDFLRDIGPVTYERGYRDGAAIRNGRTDLKGVLAGGMCSCSTTIFNAALRAGLEMGKRRNHYYYIDRYPVGLDATVWFTDNSRTTMTFTNDTPYPILIRSINSYGKVRFEIWSVPTGRTVKFSKPIIQNVRKASNTVRYTNDLPAGHWKQIELPHNGFNATVTRYVHDADGNLIHQDTYYSDYGRVIGITLFGRRPGDPPAGTVIKGTIHDVPPASGGGGGDGSGDGDGGDGSGDGSGGDGGDGGGSGGGGN